MTTTLLFDKKFACMFSTANSKLLFERKYYYNILVKGFHSSSSGPAHRLFIQDIPKLISLCDDQEIHLIAFETDLDSSEMPFFVSCFEEYGSTGADNTWVWQCLHEMKLQGITQDIIAYIDISDDQYQNLKRIFYF